MCMHRYTIDGYYRYICWAIDGTCVGTIDGLSVIKVHLILLGMHLTDLFHQM